MVDPNRKINRLTEKDIEFLDECQDEFANRFSEGDEEFVLHCSNPLADPPIIETWGSSGQSFGHHGYGRAHYGGGNRGNRGGWFNRGRDRGYDRRYGGGGGRSYRNRRPHFNSRAQDESSHRENEERPPHQPINVRRDYGNFVPASKE